MPPAIIAAGIGAVGAIGGGLISAGAQKSAASQATQATTSAQNQATQAQLQLGQQSLNQLGDIYKSNYNTLSPFVSNGISASNSLNALLGLPAGPTLTPPTTIGSTNPASSGASATPPPNALGSTPTMAQIQALQHDGIPGDYKAALAQYGMQPQSSGGIPGIVSPVGALLTGGGMFG